MGTWPQPTRVRASTPGISLRSRGAWRAGGRMRSNCGEASSTGQEIRSRSLSARVRPERSPAIALSAISQRIDLCARSTASLGVRRSPRYIASRSARRRLRGRHMIAGSRGAEAFVSRSWRAKKRARRRVSPSPSVQPPAGASATTLRARPRFASSSASAPPIEFPTRWAFPTPSSSRCPSSESAPRSSVMSQSAGYGGPPSCPASVGAMTS